MNNTFDVRKNRTFILGAGFSAEAGIPLTAQLLKLTMQKFSEEAHGLFERVDNYVRESIGQYDDKKVDYSKVDFSHLCTFLEYIELREDGGGEKFSDIGSREKVALRYFLAKTIVEHTPLADNIPQLYLDFADQLHENDVIITFNWDLLLEITLLKIGKSYTYNWDRNGSIKISKLHGSVNWRIGKPNLKTPFDILNWEPLHPEYDREETEIYQSQHLISKDFWEKDFPNITPFLVLPGYGKAYDVRFNTLTWYKPESIFSFTKDIYIIGLSLAADDFFIKSFFLANLPNIMSFSNDKDRKIIIITPDRYICKNYDFIVDKDFTILLNEKFSFKHVNLMKDRLSLKTKKSTTFYSKVVKFINKILCSIKKRYR